jgi:hypothetical protein
MQSLLDRALGDSATDSVSRVETFGDGKSGEVVSGGGEEAMGVTDVVVADEGEEEGEEEELLLEGNDEL